MKGDVKMKIVNLAGKDLPKGKIFYLKNNGEKYFLARNFETDREIICRDNGDFWTLDEFFKLFSLGNINDYFFNDDEAEDCKNIYNVVIQEN